MLKQPDLFYSQSFTLPEEALAKLYLSTTLGLSFMINSAAPTRSSTSYAYLITKIGNRNLNIGMYRLILELLNTLPSLKSVGDYTEINFRQSKF